MPYKEAFDFGKILYKAVIMKSSPSGPVKAEKVYLGSIMQTMKRYCGMKFESKDQKIPIFDMINVHWLRKFSGMH
jgi:hypothetical protein